jgi:Glycosyl transferases group 1
MRLFQNSGIYPGYRPRLASLTSECASFAEYRSAFLNDRYGACHFLSPVLDGEESAFFTNGDDQTAQRLWAIENGMARSASLEAVLLAQIEHHRTDVFYNLDPMRYGSAFVRKLPGCVKRTVAWRAAPSPGADFSAYDLVVCNFPSILKSYAERGWRSAYFFPAHDPEMDAYAANTDRPVDVVFVGGYSRHHRNRAEVLEAVASECKHLHIVFHLDRSRLTRLAESSVGRFLPVRRHCRPAEIRAVSADPVFGRALYEALSQAKIVINGAVDMAGSDRGNMRCFEALGCGALLVTDFGQYPKGMNHGETMLTYRNGTDATDIISSAMGNIHMLKSLASRGHQNIRSDYNKANQWDAFLELVGSA